jgi:nitrite reductase/ring-hydroxylating ferredoxin subunit
VAQAQQLADGESLHLDLNGTLIALIRSEGEFYAVQDFCSHRYGPLSEGRICDAKVECPWHRSCFDLRTGEVVEGPAKVNLRTFPTRLENGKVLVRVPTPA